MTRRTSWIRIAKKLDMDYIENLRCKICGREITPGETTLKTLANIYRHFKIEHPDKIEEAKSKQQQ